MEDVVISALIKAGIKAAGGVMLPGEGSITVPSAELVVPAWHATRGATRLVAEFPSGDAAWAAFAASLGGRRDALVARVATAIWVAASSPPDPSMMEVVEAAKERVHSRVRVPRLSPIKITVIG